MKNSLSIISTLLFFYVCCNVESNPYYCNSVNIIEVNIDMPRETFYKYIYDNRKHNKCIGDEYYSNLGHDEACKKFAEHYPITNSLTNAEDIRKKYNNDNAIIKLLNLLLKEYSMFFNRHSRTKNLEFFSVFVKAWNKIFNIVQKDKENYTDDLRWKMTKISNYFEYFNPIGFKVNIDMSPEELIKYAYDNRDYNKLIGDTRTISIPKNYIILDKMLLKKDFNLEDINALLQEHIRFFNHHSTKEYWEISGYFEQAWWKIWNFLYDNILNIKQLDKSRLKQNIKLIKRVKILFRDVLPKVNCKTFAKEILKEYKLLKKIVIEKINIKN